MESQAVRNVNAIDILSFDVGNRFTKWVVRDNSYKIPSYVHELEPYQDQLVVDKQSVIVENDEGRFAVGNLAKELGGKAAFKGNKAEFAKLLILAGIFPVNGNSYPVKIKTLRLALPDSRNEENRKILDSLVGSHAVVRNGKHFTYEIGKVEIIDECVGAYRYCKHHKSPELLQYIDAGMPNAIIDCGGGTILGRVFFPSGNFPRDLEFKIPGTFALAGAVAAALAPKFTYTPSLDSIMDAIADNSFTLGSPGVDFSREYQRAHQVWFDNIRTTAATAWKEKKNDIGEVLLIGGSAPLLNSWQVITNGRVKVAKNHQFIGVKGMGLEV